MNIVRGIKSYITENEFKIIILNNKINISNYSDIGHFDDNKICIKSKEMDVIINGNSLSLLKLVSNETLITGDFKSIEFRRKS